MSLGSPDIVTADVLIIGGGGAGIRAAIEAKEHGVDVLIVSKSRVGYGSNTAISGGAFAAVSVASTVSGDSPEQHLKDTIAGGCYLNDQSLVETMVWGAEQQLEDLRRFGVRYTTVEESPWITLSLDPGHSCFRLFYGQTPLGTDFTLPLRNYALGKGVRFAEGVLITRLLQKKDKVVGAIGIDSRGEIIAFSALTIVLTCGGLGQAYMRTDTTAGTTGDGYALAYDAGAVLQDMEFVQFYPTSLGSGNPAVFYECLFFETGSRLLNKLGEDVLVKHRLNNPMLLTRERLSLAIAREQVEGRSYDGKIVLDLTEVADDKMEMLLDIMPKSARHGEQRLMVAPTAHFHMGGVKINRSAETSLPGLYAAGEVCAGIQGANRLSGNAITELWVFGTVAGRESAEKAKEMERARLPADDMAAETAKLAAFGQNVETIEQLRQYLKETMWHGAGIIRCAEGLQQALDEVEGFMERLSRVSVSSVQELKRAVQLSNMLTASEMVCRTALCRTESRGAHYREDHPEQDNDLWLCNVHLVKRHERMTLNTAPVKLTNLSP